MSEYATLRKNQNQLHTACKKANIQSSNTRTASSPVVQMIRKRVYHEQDAFTANDIYYDKNSGDYYKNIIQSSPTTDVTVIEEVYKQCQDLLSKYSGRTTILAEAKTTNNKDTFIQFDESLQQNSETNSYTGTLPTFTDGDVLTSEPKAIRLYAEGKMDHALSLDASLNSSEAYQKFITLPETLPDSNTDSSSASTPLDVLIKATEYDSRDLVKSRYEADQKINQKMDTNIHKTQRTEISFGGTTGDMTHEVSESSKRKYDLIQATFFLIPEKTNDENSDVLKKFMLKKRDKLKNHGKMRIVLSNKNNTERRDYNHYREVADKLIGNEELKTFYILSLRVLKHAFKDKFRYGLLACSYSEELKYLGLNPHDFKHTRTYGDIEVTSESGDLVIEATLKPQSATTPEHPN